MKEIKCLNKIIIEKIKENKKIFDEHWMRLYFGRLKHTKMTGLKRIIDMEEK